MYFQCAKGGQVNSLKVITSVFRLKSSEEKKKGLYASDCPLYIYHLYTTKVLCLYLRGGGATDPGHLPPRKGLVTPLLYNEIVSCLFSDVYD